MIVDGKQYELAGVMFEDKPCLGCAFINEHCIEIVGNQCEENGSWVWVEVPSEIRN